MLLMSNFSPVGHLSQMLSNTQVNSFIIEYRCRNKLFEKQVSILIGFNVCKIGPNLLKRGK